MNEELSSPADGRRGILAGGNWLVDHVKVIDRWPEQDGLAEVSAYSTANGGGPYNVLKDLALLGAPFPREAVGLVGDDDDGRGIRADCGIHKIDTTQLHFADGAHTGFSDVMTVRGMGRRMVRMPWVLAALSQACSDVALVRPVAGSV